MPPVPARVQTALFKVSDPFAEPGVGGQTRELGAPELGVGLPTKNHPGQAPGSGRREGRRGVLPHPQPPPRPPCPSWLAGDGSTMMEKEGGFGEDRNMEHLPVETISPTSTQCLWPSPPCPCPQPLPLPEMQEQNSQRPLIISLPDLEH